MVVAKKIVDEFTPEADVTESPIGWEWETVAEAAATRVVFDTIGDTFVGQFIGIDHIDREPSANGEDQSFDLYNFRGRDGDLYAVNNSYSLQEPLSKPDVIGKWVRLTYIKDVKTGRKLNDMKSFQVDIRK